MDEVAGCRFGHLVFISSNSVWRIDAGGSGGGTYRSAGVDIDAADAAKDRIAARVAATHGVSVLRGVGFSADFFGRQ